MGYLDQLDRPRPYGAVTPNASADFWYQPIGMLAGAGVRVDEAAAMRVATFWRCTQVLADAVGMLPLHVYERTGGGKRRATGHWAYRLLHDRPNPLQTPLEFKAEQMNYLILGGNAFARKEFALDGSVRALWPLPPSRVQVDTLTDGTRRYRYRQDDQTEVTYSAEEIWHVRRWSRGGMGQSLLTHTRESLGLAIALEQHAGSFFRSGAKPGGIVKYPGSLSKEAKQRFIANWNETHQGASNAYKLTVLDEGMDWVAAQMSNEDAQFLALREYQREDILAWFGVPPHLAGYLTKQTTWGSGVEELSLLFLVYTLTPWLVVWEQSANLEFLDGEPDLFPEFLVDALLRGAAIARAEAFSKQLQGGALTPNEWRAAENRNPEAGGDRLILPANMLPAEDLGKAAAPGNRDPRAAAARGLHQEGVAATATLGTNETDTIDIKEAAATIMAAHHMYEARLRPFVEDAAARVVHKEQTVLAKAWTRAGTDLESWQAEVNRFYAGHEAYAAEQLRVTQEAVGEYAATQQERLQAGLLAMDEWDAARQELVALAMTELERVN